MDEVEQKKLRLTNAHLAALAIILVLVALGVYGAFSQFRTKPETSPLGDPLGPDSQVLTERDPGRAPVREEEVVTDIGIKVGDETVGSFNVDEVVAISQPMPDEFKVFDEQRVIELKDFLAEAGVESGSRVIIRGNTLTGKEEISYSFDEIQNGEEAPVLILTLVPSWKLSHKVAGELPPPGPRYLLIRIVTEIVVQP